MARFRVTTAWCTDDGERPWLLNSYDEIGEDEWGGVPDYFTEAVDKAKKGGADVRLLDLFIDYDRVEQCFKVATLDVTEIASRSGEQPPVSATPGDRDETGGNL